MKIHYKKVKVLENIEISKDIYKLIIEDDAEIQSGQFYMLKTKETLLGRPISVCEAQEGKITFLYAIVGKGTEELSLLRKDDNIQVLGPLGNGFDENKNYGRVALVAGGIGIAPMLQLSKKLREKRPDITMDLYAGFKDDTYIVEEISKYSNNFYISTNSGKHGVKGFITELLNPKGYDTVLCCGPEVMMNEVIKMCKEAGVQIYVSMEKHMACGVGACLVCTCKTKMGNRRTCKDGPVFNGYDIEV